MQSERASHLGLVKNQLVGKENIPCTEDGLDTAFKSKIPVLIKATPMPYFNSIHQSFQNKFQKGKAVRKKACTRPCPFNLTKKGERFQLQPVTDVSHQPLPESDRTLCPSKNRGLQGPLLENRQRTKCDATAEGFKADPAALASILSNSGLSSKAMGISRAASVVQRVPLRESRNDGASACLSCGSSLSRVESIYSSCTSRKMAKALEETPQQTQDLKPVLLSRPLPSLLMGMSSTAQPKTDSQAQSTGVMPGTEELCRAGQGGTGERRAGVAGGKGNLAEDRKPVIQDALAESLLCPVVPKNVSLLDPVASAPDTCPSVPNSLTCLGTVTPSICSVVPENLACPAVAAVAPDGVLSKAVEDSKDFVPDLEALASILSNTGLTSSRMASSKKSSMAQRVPVRGRPMTSLYSAGSSSSMANRGSLFGQRMSFDPKMSSGHKSRLEFKEREMCGTPFRVPEPSTKPLPPCSAQRVAIQHPLYPLHRSLRRRPVFPKTQDKATVAETQQTPSLMCRQRTNVPSPQSLDSGGGAEEEDAGLPMEKIAVQLFSDVGAAAGDLGPAVALPSVEVNQDMNKLKRIELLARLFIQEMEGIAQPSASRDLGTFMPADKIQSSRNSPASSRTLSKPEDGMINSKRCPAPCQLNQPTAESGLGTCVLQNRVPSGGGLAAGLWDTGGSSTDQSGSPPCCPVPAVASDTFLDVDKTLGHPSQRPLCSNQTSQAWGPPLDLGPGPQSLTAVSLDRAVHSPRLPRIPTTSHVVKQRLYRLATSSQRFKESCLDDECAFYTSRIARQSQDSRLDAREYFLNPVAETLAWQEALSFIPIKHGEV
ncbi:tastin isoform X2 [Microcaecilia unicolor]|uniref:Tastin isoform X2 n=1 Tax=Microcaecilia unicolor TaxID=1415580 RepID=A0A6P7XPQ2_9AMPH|nr:tastin isoform X2 [Microcaecilia unicolor]